MELRKELHKEPILGTLGFGAGLHGGGLGFRAGSWAARIGCRNFPLSARAVFEGGSMYSSCKNSPLVMIYHAGQLLSIQIWTLDTTFWDCSIQSTRQRAQPQGTRAEIVRDHQHFVFVAAMWQ